MTTELIAVRVVLAIGLIIALSHLLGWLARRLGQPAVIGHLFAGIALGPSLLGRLPGDLNDLFFPPEVIPYISVVSQVALVLFLFAVGYELDRRVLQRRMRVVPIVAVACLIIPMALGAGSTVVFSQWYGKPYESGVPRGAFVLFIAIALSITAVPVLAGIVREHRLTNSASGVISLTAAGIIDGLGWLLLAVALLNANTDDHGSWQVMFGLLVVYLLVMLFVVRPLLRSWLKVSTSPLGRKVPVVTAIAMGSAWATGALGLHVILGAFLAGLLLPTRQDGEPHPELLRPVQETGSVLLPVFFVVSGLSTDIGALGKEDLGLFLVVCGIAVVGKVGAGLLATRMAGLSWRDSTAVGMLLNTRGLTELIALNVGLQAGIIDERLYTIFVLMALITTAMAGPVLKVLRPGHDGRDALAGHLALPADDATGGSANHIADEPADKAGDKAPAEPVADAPDQAQPALSARQG